MTSCSKAKAKLLFHQTDEEDYENSEFLDNIVAKEEECEFHKMDLLIHFLNKKYILWQLQSVGILSAVLWAMYTEESNWQNPK